GGMTNEKGTRLEFCKKSVQAMAHDMQPPIADDFFERNSYDTLAQLSPRELENLGRLSYPVVLNDGDTHYRRIAWDTALDRIANTLRATDPRRAFFYSSGRSSNEAAFLLQWLARVYGTNNINNCSYYCHQASGVALGASVGTSTATVTLDDVEHADFVLLLGSNAASNHPRLITQLVRIRARGGVVVVINPMREAGLERFNIPSHPGSLLFGSQVSDHYVMPRIGGDIALLKGMLKVVIDENALDLEYIERHTTGFDEVVSSLSNESLDTLAENAGVDRTTIEMLGRLYAGSKKAVFMWAMGITHHEHGVDNVAAIANLALARGMIGRPHAGLLPVRGHSNVQGIGSVGFAPELKAGFLDAMERMYGLVVPDWKGMDSIESVHASHRVEVDFALLNGGNFYGANPDLGYAGEALSRIATTVHISTKLNLGHVRVRSQRVGGETIILPTVVRDEELDTTTQESMFSFVRLSEGRMKPPPGEMRSEVEIICAIGSRMLPANGSIDFSALRNHDAIRAVMADVVPGYSAVKNIGESKQEFHVGGRVRHEPRFDLPDGRARFLDVATPLQNLGSGELRLMTIRSEGQFNTVVYEEHDRYRNQRARDVILMNSSDIDSFEMTDGDRVTVRSAAGTMHGMRVAEFAIAKGCAAMYYPEANVLVERHVDPKSGTPAYKNVRVTVERETT
ncbi:MAG: FdhF/YdeP family oxidoreductase, partial [bacterium]|nr:FdhF/YdeP family oxidoreductase [Candidatus Kapabacteria bacterium]